jgi:hypothetical protein
VGTTIAAKQVLRIDDVKELQKEVSTLSKLAHLNILQLYGISTNEHGMMCVIIILN